MTAKTQVPLSTYQYDPLDRLSSCTTQATPVQRFYHQDRLATEIEGGTGKSVFRVEAHVLAVKAGSGNAALLATDQPGSVLHAAAPGQSTGMAYTPYGHRAPVNGLLSVLGFNGERPDPATGHYLLGDYRLFNSTVLRCNSPDDASPFGMGGLNAYASYMNDPVNYIDPDGHSILGRVLRFVRGTPANSKVAAKVPELLKMSDSGKSTLKTMTHADMENVKIVIRNRVAELDRLSVNPTKAMNIRQVEAAEKVFNKRLNEKSTQDILYAHKYLSAKGDPVITKKSSRYVAELAAPTIQAQEMRLVREDIERKRYEFFNPPDINRFWY